MCYSISGIYGDSITLETLKDFHRRRVQILAESGADIIAFETIPNKLEAQVVLHITASHLALVGVTCVTVCLVCDTIRQGIC